MFFAAFSYADEIEGYMIPEYYMVGSHHSGGTDEGGIEGQHGFWLRRVYFGYKTDLGDGWSAHLRFEMNSTAFGSTTLDPYVKNAQIKKDLGGGLSLIAGIMEPPSFDKIEKFWGYRFVEKTAPDMFKLASSRDFGIALDGKTKGGIVYTVMYGNYSSNKGEVNKGKGFYGRLGWEGKSIYLEANGHFANENGTDYTYLTFFGGFKGGWGRLGAGYHHLNKKPEEGESTSTGIISAFGVVNFGKKTEAFVRYDHFTDLNFKDIDDYLIIPAKHFESRFIIAGLNFKLNKMVEISPNVKYVMYTGDGKPDNDFYLNLTAIFKFKTGIGEAK